MYLTQHTDYSLRLLIYLLAHRQSPVSVRQVAESYGISLNHLAKVAQRLSQLGWITTQRGRGGGLSVQPGTELLTLGEVVRALEPMELVECHGASSRCPIEPACRLKFILHEAVRAFIASLDQHTLGELAQQPEQIILLLAIAPAPAKSSASDAVP